MNYLEEQLLSVLAECGSSLYAFCVYLTGNKDMADDLYQDMFVVFLQKSSVLKIDTMSQREIKNYLMAVASNIWKNTKRKQKRQEKIFVEDYLPEKLLRAGHEKLPEEQVIAEERRNCIRKCVCSLPYRLQQVILLYYTGQLKTGEIAGILGIPEATVRSRLYKARNKIRLKLEEENFGFGE